MFHIFISIYLCYLNIFIYKENIYLSLFKISSLSYEELISDKCFILKTLFLHFLQRKLPAILLRGDLRSDSVLNFRWFKSV